MTDSRTSKEKLVEQSAVEYFSAYFEQNYYGTVVFSDPRWHAPKVFRAAMWAMKQAQKDHESHSGGDPGVKSACLPADDRGLAEARSNPSTRSDSKSETADQAGGQQHCPGDAGETGATDKQRSLTPHPSSSAHEPPADPVEAAALQSALDYADSLKYSDSANATAMKRLAKAARAAQPPGDELQALRNLAQWCWAYRAELEKDVLDNDQDVVETRDKMFAALDVPAIGLRPTLTKLPE